MTAMKCPFCQNANTQVTDSRLLEETNSIRRRRRCLSCGQRFSTFETIEMRMPQVIKTSGSRVGFNPHKLRTSLERALHKRPVSAEKIDETVALIEQRLYRLGKKEIPSQMVGEMAMEELAKIDQVAYVRFASVYKSFNDVSEFTQAIATLPQIQTDEAE
ncbi:transcriptional repressor NrdR [Neisseria perflava]|nr:transcriptional repressor NrdR [Neisseria perflava]